MVGSFRGRTHMFTDPLPTASGRSVRQKAGSHGPYTPLWSLSDAQKDALEPLLTGTVSRLGLAHARTQL